MGSGGSSTTGGSSGTVDNKGNEVHIMNAKNEDRTTSFFSQPGILAGKIRVAEKWLVVGVGSAMESGLGSAFAYWWLGYK